MGDREVVLAFQARHARIRSGVDRIITAMWAALPAYNEAEVAQFVAAVESIVPVAQSATATLVDAYVARLTGEPVVGVPADVYETSRGVALADVYRRPFIDTWSSLSKGTDYAQAVANGGARAVKLAVTDQQLAMRASMVHVAERNDRVVGYRRVLTGASCKFCATAATQRYHKAQLMPLHSHCDCSVAPVMGDRDPGRVVNRDLLDNLKAQGPDYWKQKGFVAPDGSPLDPTDLPHELGAVGHVAELGPVLSAA